MDGKNATATANEKITPARAYVGFYVERDTRDELARIARKKGGLSISDVARAAVIEYVDRNNGGQQ